MSNKNSTLSLAILSSILAILLFVLGAYTYFDYRQHQLDEQELTDAKIELTKQLEELKEKYENVEALNGVMDEHLEEAKKRIVNLLDTIRFNEPKIQMLLKLRSELDFLESEKAKLYKVQDSLVENIMKKDIEISEKDMYLDKAEKHREVLIEENEKLFSKLSENKKLNFFALEAEGIRIKNDGSTLSSTRFKKVDAIKACFKILENNLADVGDRPIRIKLYNPKGKIIGKKIIRNNDGEEVTYSKEKTIDYLGEEMNVCFFISPNKEEMSSGLYTVKIYDNHKLTNSTSFVLN